jgi:hypothetical protein
VLGQAVLLREPYFKTSVLVACYINGLKGIVLTGRVLFLASASISLYCGVGELLLVPHAWNEPYWAKERFVYGVVPLVIGFTMATIAGWVAVAKSQHGDLVSSVSRHYMFALCGVPAVFLFLCLNDLWFHVPLPPIP